MKIQLKQIPIREVMNGYADNGDAGVVGYGGKLDIRPPYQREFVYGVDKRNEVIKTVRKDFPLNVMYWVLKRDRYETDADGNLILHPDDEFEVLDGQQRTISIGQYVAGDFSVVMNGDPNPRGFDNLTPAEREQILNYNLQIYICAGEDRERLEWFDVINTAGEPLTKQELRNANYFGSWLSDAKRYFMKSNSPGYNIGKDFITIEGSQSRGKGLETAIRWISGAGSGDDEVIRAYMAAHQNDLNAEALWAHFQKVIEWICAIFVVRDSARLKLMKDQAWGELYDKYASQKYDADELEREIEKLILDDEVENKRGIYPYVLSGRTFSDERHLSLRAFDDKTKQQKYAEQNGICPICKQHFSIEEMDADHIMPWSRGGKTTAENCQMLCRDDNRRKSDR